ncbi:MAG TPA: hypothetical protein VJC39_00740 [Candidatus Nanoarchaeia archaeon]|nr:hypothetical protein [Candidatus Nanoarchaeia archaeon]
MKRTGFEGLLKEHEVGKVEVERKVDTGQSDYGELMRKYEEVLEAKDYSEIKTIDDILAPSDINAFLQVTIKYEQHQNYDWRTGKFISQLIQKSYDAGNNGFVLNTQKVKGVHNLGYKIQGTKERKIELKIEGDAGYNCGSNSKDSTITIEGNVGNDCGSYSNNSTITIAGNAGYDCGIYSKNSTITIGGNVGDYCGYYSNNSIITIEGNAGERCGGDSNNSTITIGGNVGDLCGSYAHDSTFKISNPELFYKLVPKILTNGNKVIYTHEQGIEKTYTKWRWLLWQKWTKH